MIAICRLSIVIANEDAEDNLAEIFRNLNPGKHLDTQFLVCSSNKLSHLSNLPDDSNVSYHLVEGRIPHLWKFGFTKSLSHNVALTTAHCIPSKDWVDTLLEKTLSDNTVAVGGAIDNHASTDTLGWAIYFLRYQKFGSSRPTGFVDHIAADNALYSRSEVLKHHDLLEGGFWEPSFHDRFHKDGKLLLFEPRLLVLHKNKYSLTGFVKQRFEHGTEFGIARSQAMDTKKLLCFQILSPVIPLVFFAKIARQAWRNKIVRYEFLKCIPVLFFLVCVWCVGEIRGYWHESKKRLSSIISHEN